MSDLIQIGRSGVLAYQGALAAVGENVTNADTDGFARREVVLKEQHAPGGSFQLYRTSAAFGGVQASEVKRVWDQYKAANAWSSNSDASAAGTRAQYLATVETMLDDGDNGVGVKLTAVFTSATQLAANPSDTTLRQTMLANVANAAQALGQTAADLGKVAGTVRTQAATLVDQANDALEALGKLNVALHASPQGSAGRAQLEDQRDSLLGTLSAAVGLDVTLDADGAATLRLDDYGGARLLAANSASPAFLQLQPASDGRLAMAVTDGDGAHAVTPTGGKLAGLVDVAATIAGRRAQVDGLAARFASALNDWQAQGRTAAGVAGAPLLTGTDAATLAAATTDPAAIAAGDGTTENGNLLAISALRGDDGVEAQWRAMATDQALMVSAANTQSSAASARKDGAYSSLDETSGIDLDAEAADLLRYQQAYSASAKIIQTARETLQSILDIV